jgi:TatD DNase family protein
LEKLREIASANDKVVAIGEIGLDYFRNHSEPENQKKLFKHCLTLAQEMDLPVILHNRNADDDFLEIIKQASAAGVKGVVHCFSGGVNFLKEVLALGFHVSFTGSITFDKAEDLRKVITQVPIERLLLETDSPYITPVPHRGKRNEPAYVKLLLDVYSKLYSLSPEDIARVTTHNANKLFGLGLKEKSKIVYPIRDSVYLNITNRCTNRCTFCTRQDSDFVMGHNLRLSGEPQIEEVINELKKIKEPKEVVFCGYGEPTLRLEAIKKIARYLKEKNCRVRLTTNGEGNLIYSRSIAPELKGLIDQVSISMNAFDDAGFKRLCKSVFGDGTFEAILGFIDDCVKQEIEFEITCVDVIGEEGVSKCRTLAESHGARFRLRKMDMVG